MAGLPFRIDLEDIRFVLYEQLDIDVELTKLPKYESFTPDVYDAMLDEGARIARDVLHPINGPGDRVGCKLDRETGNVTTPEGFREAWKVQAEGGWIGISAPAEVGGVGLPHSVTMAVTEMFCGAAMAYQMYPGLTAAAARVIHAHGPEAWRQPIAERMFSGRWAGTMCLTEAGAGSDVGENRCKATPVPGEDGAYLLEGEKIFISGGDSDVSFEGNIVHLVLARTPDSPAGTKGLSLFLVPKFLFDEGFANTTRNGAYVVGIEEKMGIHGSSTCTLALGDRGPCKGWLVGREHAGIEIMFLMMNEARIGVGVQGLAIASMAHQYAKQYAAERLQGSSAEKWKDPTAPRVPIAQHPDVRRMLMTQKVCAETLRSLTYRMGHRFDLAENDPAQHDRLIGQVELVVPVLKAFGTDIAFDNAVLGVQILGGYGYIGEYPMEQLVRDAKITSLYEGTNGIQAMDLIGRKLRVGNGALFLEWMNDSNAECRLAKEAGFAAEAEAVEKAIGQLAQTTMHMGSLGAQGRLDLALVQAYPYLRLFGTVQLGVEALIQARVAARVIAEKGSTPHLAGKAANLKFYVRNLLPGATALAKAIQASDDSCLDPALFSEA
jgi:alkylation response protein AidB-like acyl-CoA dehydrogenase